MIKKLIIETKNLLKEYKITYISILIFTIFYTIFKDNTNNIILSILALNGTFILGSALTETLNKKDKKKLNKYCLITNIVISLIFSIFTYLEIIFNDNFISKLFILYLIVMPIIIVIINYKNSKTKFSEYLLNITSNIFKTIIVNAVLLIGLNAILFLFEELILQDTYSESFLDLIILETGIYYIPSLLYSLKYNDNISKFVKILVTKILFILLSIAYIIIYLYIFKIIITRNMPSNIIFTVVTILFVGTTIISIMTKNNENNKIIEKINNNLHYLFIPFVILQTYSLLIRISNYGITITRYFGILTILLEITYIIIKILKKDESYILHTIICLLIIGLIMPFINCEYISLHNQMHRINKYINIDMNRAYNSYIYLKDFEQGEKLINKKLNDNEIKKLETYNGQTDKENNYVSFLIDDNYQYNINDYNYLKNISYYSNEDTSKIELNENELTKLNDAILTISKINNEDYESFEKNNEIIFENKKLIITSIYINVQNSKIEYYNISGYLLYK